MALIHAQIIVTLKKDVLDPQGQAIISALSSLNFNNINTLNQGKIFNIQINETDHDRALMQLTQMAEQLLANMVIENYQIKILNPADI